VFESLSPFFSNKPIVIICNKVDILPMENLKEKDRALIDGMVTKASLVPNTHPSFKNLISTPSALSVSTLSGIGVLEAKQIACDTLLSRRIMLKSKSSKAHQVLNRIHLAEPRVGRDCANCDPRMRKSEEKMKRSTRRNMTDHQNKIQERDEEEYANGASLGRFDTPQILDGHNLADFGEDIIAKLAVLEHEEDQASFQRCKHHEFDTIHNSNTIIIFFCI
jgi:nucleolar GTP-binding protein